MTSKEARTVCRIMALADHGCHQCAQELLILFARAQPSHVETARKVYANMPDPRESGWTLSDKAIWGDR